jgi:hypothetical protein
MPSWPPFVWRSAACSIESSYAQRVPGQCIQSTAITDSAAKNAEKIFILKPMDTGRKKLARCASIESGCVSPNRKVPISGKVGHAGAPIRPVGCQKHRRGAKHYAYRKEGCTL